MKTFRLIISGKVQGVNYRASAQRQATSLHLSGTVRNLPSGEVEAVATGDPEQLHHFIEWARKGPERARVTNVVAEEIALTLFSDFQIIR